MPYTHSPLIPMTPTLLSAGRAVEFTENDYSLLDLNQLVTGGHDGWIAYKITGDSMCPAIQPGSIVFVNTMAAPKNGDYVVALIDGEVCIKEFHQTQKRLFLVPKNGSYSAREVTVNNSVHILGVARAGLNFF